MPDSLNRDKFDALADLQFLFVTGKGGVGKSTCAALLALHAARRGRHVLVVSPQSSHKAPSPFGVTLGTMPTKLTLDSAQQPAAAGSSLLGEKTGSLSAMQISAEGAMKEYVQQVLHSQALANALFHPRVAGGFLAGIPGLNDWALLGKSWAYSRSGTFELPKGQRHYDLVIFDAPASGDGTKMLKVPQVILDLSPQGRLRDEAALCLEMLRDPHRSAVVVVSLAEDFSIVETIENVTFIRKQLAFPTGPLILNRILRSLLSKEEAQRLREAQDASSRATSADSAQDSTRSPSLTANSLLPSDREQLGRVLQGALHYAQRQHSQEHQLLRLSHEMSETIQVPEITYKLGRMPSLSHLLQDLLNPRAGDARTR